MVDSLATFLRDKMNLQLRGVAHDNYPDKPWEIGGKVPDVIAKDNDKELLVLGEAKTADDINNDHTKDQLTAWSNQAMANGKSKNVNVPIYLSVPKDHADAANAAIQKWGLGGKVTVVVYG